MWKTLHGENALKKAYRYPNRYSNKQAACQASAHASGVSASVRSGGVAGFDVPAKAAFRRDVLDVAHGKPHLAGRNAGTEGLVRGASADPCQDQRAAQDPGVPRPELVVHKPPKVTDSHE